jgi:hypothetical protein
VSGAFSFFPQPGQATGIGTAAFSWRARRNDAGTIAYDTLSAAEHGHKWKLIRSEAELRRVG